MDVLQGVIELEEEFKKSHDLCHVEGYFLFIVVGYNYDKAYCICTT